MFFYAVLYVQRRLQHASNQSASNQLPTQTMYRLYTDTDTDKHPKPLLRRLYACINSRTPTHIHTHTHTLSHTTHAQRLGTGPPLAGVWAPFAGVLGAGVGALLGAALVTALRLWAMWALTRWPAQRALLSDSSPASTPAPMMRASWRALSPGVSWWAPRTPSRSSMALWGSRIVPPPMVPTSIEGMETEIWRLPFMLRRVSCCSVQERPFPLLGKGNVLVHDGDAVCTFYNLGRVLARGEEDGRDDVGSVSVEPAD